MSARSAATSASDRRFQVVQNRCLDPAEAELESLPMLEPSRKTQMRLRPPVPPASAMTGPPMVVSPGLQQAQHLRDLVEGFPCRGRPWFRRGSSYKTPPAHVDQLSMAAGNHQGEKGRTQAGFRQQSPQRDVPQYDARRSAEGRFRAAIPLAAEIPTRRHPTRPGAPG